MRGPPALVRSVATVGAMTLASRLLGFVRDVMMAAVLGAGPLADAFLVAFKLPNFLRRLFAEGAFNAGFVPQFARTLEAEGPAIAKDFAEQAQAVLFAVLAVVVAVGLLLMPWIIRVMAPGFEPGGERYAAAVELGRITFAYILFISLVALYGGVLNSFGRFAAAAAAPIVLNLCMILAMLLSTFWLGAPAHLLAWGVAVSGLAQLAWLALALKRAGLMLRPRWPRLSPEIKRLFSLILPGVLGAGIAQLSLFADVIFASLLPAGAVSYLYYADRVAQLPLGVIGVAVGTALLPLLARQLRAGQDADAMISQNRAIELALLLTLPAAAGLAVLCQPIIGVLFQRGAFGAEAAHATGQALAAYASGLPAYVLIKVLAPGFFAREDTRTPVKIALIALAFNMVLALALIWPLQHVGIALATAGAAWLNALLLGLGLWRRDLFRADVRLRRRLPRIMLAALAMALCAWLIEAWLAPLSPALALLAAVGGGGVMFLALAQLLGGLELRELVPLLRRARP
jgi:putative peptidoglycan lipid II flippase